jgi:glycosyltransferase involved in cell wall biosynthesis
VGNYRILTARRRVKRLLDARPPDVLEVSDTTPAGMAEAVRRLLAVPEPQRRAAARAAAERYPWTGTVIRLLREYEALLTCSRR